MASTVTRTRRRRAFSLLELLLASTFTAIACTAASLLIKSINNTATTTSGLQAGVTAARNAMACTELLIEQAALVGYWDNDRVLLWRNDDNGDGRINLLELTLVYHNTVTHELSLQEVRLPVGTPVAQINLQNTTVPLSAFVTLAQTQQIQQHSYLCTRRLIGGLSQFKAWCDGTDAKARTVQMMFTVTCNDGEQAFCSLGALRDRTRDTVP